MTAVVITPRAASSQFTLGRPPTLKEHDNDVGRYADAMERYLGRLVEQLELQAEILTKPGERQYTATNVTESRTIDADTITLAELADVVGQLILDLRA